MRISGGGTEGALSVRRPAPSAPPGVGGSVSPSCCSAALIHLQCPSHGDSASYTDLPVGGTAGVNIAASEHDLYERASCRPRVFRVEAGLRDRGPVMTVVGNRLWRRLTPWSSRKQGYVMSPPSR